MLDCVYCLKNKFDVGKGSLEHVILSSLGGRKGSRNICCGPCNNRLGNSIDEPFADEFSFFSTMLGITTGRNKPAPTHKRFLYHDGRAYDIGPNGRFTLSKREVEVGKPDESGKKKISITTATPEQARFQVEQILNSLGKSEDDLQTFQAQLTTAYIPAVEERISLGGHIQLRCVAKMLLTYAATLISPERLRDGTFQKMISYINETNSNFEEIGLDQQTIFPATPQLDPINHRVFFTASKRNKLAIGLLEIYGQVRYSAVLSREWTGPSISKGYAINPVTQEHIELNLKLGDNVFCLHGERCFDLAKLMCSLGELIKTFQERQTHQQISEIIAAALEKHIVGKGEIMTEQMLNAFISEVATKYAKFHLRIDSVEDIDLKSS